MTKGCMLEDHSRLQHSIHITGVLVQDGLEHMRIGQETNGPELYSHVWRRTGEQNHPSMTVERHQQFGGSFMFWAGVMFDCRMPLVPIDCMPLVPIDCCSVWEQHPPTHSKWFCRDCSRRVHSTGQPHRALSVQQYLVEHGIRRMDWPACSPDMNCIEHAWSFLWRAISNRPHHPLTIQELRNAALEEWDNLHKESLNALVLSMPRRIQECLRVHGGPTHY